MELLRNWLLGVTCAAMVMALAEALTPEGSIRRICRLAGGLMLVLAAVDPLLKLDEDALSRALTEYRVTAKDYGDALVEKNNVLYKTIIEENTAAYILDKAEALGISCRAEVMFAYDGDGNPYPRAVNIFGRMTEEQRERLSNLMETELGIPRSQQNFERAGT